MEGIDNLSDQAREIIEPVLDILEKGETLDDLKDEQWYMGIDEAGRGPTLGPMVYACLAWPKKYQDKLSKIGFDDSKKLKSEDREILFEVLQFLNGKIVKYEFDILSSTKISNLMLAKQVINLNQMSMNSAALCADRILQKLPNCVHCYVDTVGAPDKYKQQLESKLGGFQNLKFTVCPKADSIYPTVSAASIVAKVTRDHQIEKIQENFDQNIGSGYPSDPNTIKFLQSGLDKVFGFKNIVRYSWSTITTKESKECYEIQYEQDNVIDGRKQQYKTFSEIKVSNLVDL